jgi:ATP-dependent Lon protease
MGRKFTRLSLGGVRDEAEIRGHRRTYVGAMPGRIVQSIRRAGSNNPVFMLDEVDKIGKDFRGDPSSALLEVLDPEQNFSFSDNYLDLPMDLRNVMFITTANLLDPIPGPLRDRMEVIQLSSYTLREKVEIGRRHIWPKQLTEHGLTRKQCKIEKRALGFLIDSYTREAGVRNMEREIASVIRKVTRKVAEGEKGPFRIDKKAVAEFLGNPKFKPMSQLRRSRVGSAQGLAWTSVGGEMLVVECSRMTGKGALTLTGHLGEVMQESARAALTYVRSHSSRLGIQDLDFSTMDLHIHVPAGAVPKDGPSAGVTILVSMVSLLTDRPVPRELAMTGEITLHGDVLPVGGLKEKILAAHRYGLKQILLPEDNRDALSDVPEEVVKTLNFLFFSDIGKVLEVVFGEPLKRPKRKGGSSRRK